MILKKSIIISIIIIATCPKLLGTIHYITPNGAGLMNGNSWDNALPGISLQLTIDAALAGDSIWVSCGSYRPTTSNDRSLAFHMRNNVSIFGSFNANEALVSEREFTCGPCSILNGNIGNVNVATDNSYTIIVNIGLDHSAILDGFEISGGYDNRSINSIEAGLGGGIYNGGSGAGGEGGNCSPTFRNCTIINNYAGYGAGMFNNGHHNGNSEPNLSNCIFANNRASVGGGGMDSYGWDNGNVAPSLTNCLFYGNISDDRAGAMYCWGGRGGNCNPTIVNSAFINNTSPNIAGGIIVDNSDDLDGLPPFNGNAVIDISNSILWGNTSGSGPQFFILGTGNFNAVYSNIDTVGQTLAHPISGPGTGNIFINPQFQNINNAIGNDGCWMTLDDGLKLQIISECINAGNTSLGVSPELSFNSRISGAAIDIGPYEFDLPESVTWTGINGNDWFDVQNWNPTRVPDSLQIITIPGIETTPNQPILQEINAFCKELLLHENASFQIVSPGMLHVKGQE